MSNRDLMVSQSNRIRRSTPPAFSPLVAFASGIQLSIYARLDDIVVVAATGMSMCLGIFVAATFRMRRIAATDTMAVLFWSAMVPALVAFCFGSSFAIAARLR